MSPAFYFLICFLSVHDPLTFTATPAGPARLPPTLLPPSQGQASFRSHCQKSEFPISPHPFQHTTCSAGFWPQGDLNTPNDEWPREQGCWGPLLSPPPVLSQLEEGERRRGLLSGSESSILSN